MKLVSIGESDYLRTLSINLDDLKDQDDNSLELPPDPENNLIFDPRPIVVSDHNMERNGYTFDFKIQDSSRLIVTRTDKNEPWDEQDFSFRVYDRTKEDIPGAFDSSIPYVHWGLNKECAPADTVVAKANHTVTTMKCCAFSECRKMTICDMSDAPVEEIEGCAFYKCTSVETILFAPRVLKRIGSATFARCSAIDVLVIPSTVRNIKKYAFLGCTNMRILKLPDAIDLDHVADDIIEDCYALLAAVPANKSPKHWLKDRYDQYPLHKVCYNAYVTIEEIQQCIHEHPDAAYLSDEFNMTALHMITLIACTSNLQIDNGKDQHHQGIASWGTGLITTCFHANMSAAFAQDDRGKTPLDYLFECSNSLDVHTSLVASLCVHWNASVGL